MILKWELRWIHIHFPWDYTKKQSIDNILRLGLYINTQRIEIILNFYYV